MNKSVDAFLETVDNNFKVTEVDTGKYSKLKLFGIIKFNVKQYKAEGHGNIAVMTTNMGLFQMATVVLTPVKKDSPLISVDYMYKLGKRTAYIETFDLMLNHSSDYENLLDELKNVSSKYDNLKDSSPSSSWYDSLKAESLLKEGEKEDDDTLMLMLEDSITCLMEYAKEQPELSKDEQKEKGILQKTYSDGLIDKGGISTDMFVKALGKDETREFFDNVLFKAL